MMRKLVHAGCFLAMTALASCGGEPSDPQGSAEPQAGVKTQELGLSTSSVGLTKTATAKGTSVKLDGRFESAVIARRDADGAITTECHDDEQEAQAFLRTAPVAPRNQAEVQ